MNFPEIITTLFEPTLLKIVASGVLVFLFLFGNFHTQGIIAILMLMTIDTIFGVMAAYANGEVITSRRFSRVVQKGIVYLMAISAGYFTDLTIGWQVVQATMIGFIGVTEFVSITEKMAKMGYQTPQRLLNQLQEYKNGK